MSVVALLVGSCAKDEAVVNAQPDERDPIAAARFAFENKRGDHADGSLTARLHTSDTDGEWALDLVL